MSPPTGLYLIKQKCQGNNLQNTLAYVLCTPVDISAQFCAIPGDRLVHLIVFQPLVAGREKERL